MMVDDLKRDCQVKRNFPRDAHYRERYWEDRAVGCRERNMSREE